MKKAKKAKVSKTVAISSLVSVIAIVGLVLAFSGAKAQVGEKGGLSLDLSFGEIKELVCLFKGCEVEPEVKFGAFPGGDLSNVNIIGENVYTPRTRATTTTIGATLTGSANDITAVDYTIVSLGGAADTDFTYTFVASTSLPSFLAKPGQRAEKCFFLNASTTSEHDLIFAAGTGIDLVHATSTVPVPLGIGESQTACFEFVRQPKGGSQSVGGSFTVITRFFGDID
jgi:hypothetical protein